MSDSHGSLDRARYQRIKAEYGEGVAGLSFDVFPSPGSPNDLLILPKIHGGRRPELPEHLKHPMGPRGGVSLPSTRIDTQTERPRELTDYEEKKFKELWKSMGICNELSWKTFKKRLETGFQY